MLSPTESYALTPRDALRQEPRSERRTMLGLSRRSSEKNATWPRERSRPVDVPLRAPATPAQSPDGSPRTHGAQPVAVLRLALRPGGRVWEGAVEAPSHDQAPALPAQPLK